MCDRRWQVHNIFTLFFSITLQKIVKSIKDSNENFTSSLNLEIGQTMKNLELLNKKAMI